MARRSAHRLTFGSTPKRKIDPRALLFRRTRGGLRGLMSMGLLCLTIAGAVTIGTAAPAKSDAFLVPTKSIAAPAGFHGVCDRYAWACARRAADTRTMSDAESLAIARQVNAAVNRSVREISDQRQYRRAEHWALPTARGGDCEDFALLKKRELMRRGVAPDRLLIATALTRGRVSHAVLILRTANGDMVLDNLTNRVGPWRSTGHSFLRMQDPASPDRWQMVLAGGMFQKKSTGRPGA